MTIFLPDLRMQEAVRQRRIKLPLWEEFIRRTAEQENVTDDKIDAVISRIRSNGSSWFWLHVGYPGDDCPHMENWLRPVFIKLNRNG